MRGPSLTGRRSLYSTAVNAEFNWWLLIVGLVVGAGLVWFVVADSRRRDGDVDAQERPREALWLSAVLGEEGHEVSPQAAERMLELHRSYLDAPPPDAPLGQEPEESTGSGSTIDPLASTRETPNASSGPSPATSG